MKSHSHSSLFRLVISIVGCLCIAGFARDAWSATQPIPCSALANAVIANTGRIVSNQASLVDSYQSNKGAYGGTNVGANGNVQAATTITASGGVIQGTKTTGTPAGLAIVPVPTGATNLPLGASAPGNVNINNASQSITLAPGNYVAQSLNVNFPGAINISPPGLVSIWVKGTLNLSGLENLNGVPANLEFLVTSSQDVNINSNGKLFGFIYAPAAPVNLNSAVFGGVVGSTVNLNSQSAVHFDQNSICQPPPSFGILTFGGNGPDLCLDVAGGNIVAGATLDSATCNGSKAQQFLVIGNVHLSPASDRSLCVDGSGPVAHLAACDPTVPLQGFQAGYPTLFTLDGGIEKCLAVQGASTVSGTPIVEEECKNSVGQLFWHFGGLGVLAFGEGPAGALLGVDNTALGAALRLSLGPVVPEKTFFLTRDHQITLNGRCVNVDSIDASGNSTISMQNCNGSPNQSWYWGPLNMGSYYGALRLIPRVAGPGGVTECLAAPAIATPPLPISLATCTPGPFGPQLWGTSAILTFP